MADVFLSYSSRDRAAAARVQQALSRRDIDVFWDQQTPPGMDWDTWARGKLAESRVAIVLWSKSSVASDSVRHEAMLARKADKLLPALIDNLTPEDLPMGLYMVQSVVMPDWADAGSKGMAQLIAETEARLGRRGAAARADRLANAAKARRRASPLALLGTASLAILAIAAAFWLGQQDKGGVGTEAAAAGQEEPVTTTAAAPPTPAPSPSAPSTPSTATTSKPKPAADPCVQARADWAAYSTTDDIAVLKAFLASAPKACTTQRVPAQARLDMLQAQADAAKRELWKGVPEFDGVWVLDTSGPTGGCGNFPWTHTPSGNYIRRIYGSGDHRDMRIESTSPPTLRVRENNQGRAIIEGERMRINDKDGKLDCYLKRQ